MIVTAAYPKSGSTWFNSLLHYCTIGEMFSSSKEESLLYYTAKTKRSLILKKISLGDLFYMKVHYAYEPKHLPYYDAIRVCIYILRNPLDILASKINHCDLTSGERELSPSEREQIVMQELEIANDLPSIENNFAGGWNTNVLSWMDQKEIPVYVIKYEDLLESSYTVMTKLNITLRLGMTDERIIRGCELASFSAMKERENYEITEEIAGQYFIPKRRKAFFSKGVSFVNKGIKDNYKNILKQTEIKKAQEVFNPLLKRYYVD